MPRPILQALVCTILLSWNFVDAYDDRCPSGLRGHVEVFNCKCYEFRDSDAFWSKEKCNDRGGHLAKITDKDSDDFIKKMLSSEYPKGRPGVWIGARRRDGDAPFKWTDGSAVVYTNWAHDEPDHAFGMKQNCVNMKRDRQWKWATLQCDGKLLDIPIPYLCQYNARNCSTHDVEDNKLGPGVLIGIVVGSVLGGLFVCLLLCCLVLRCKSACQRLRKRRSQKKSVRYYSRPPSTVQGREDPFCEIGADAPRDNNLNEQLMGATAAETPAVGSKGGYGDDDSILNVKGLELPTADSIAAEVEERKPLVVDLATGRPTIKRINGPTPNRLDNASTRSLNSFKMEGVDQVSNQVSIEDSRSGKFSTSDSFRSVDDENEEDGVLANLDNVAKPSNHPTKDVSYK